MNIILGDSDQPKTGNNPPKAEKVFDLAAKVNPFFVVKSSLPGIFLYILRYLMQKNDNDSQ